MRTLIITLAFWALVGVLALFWWELKHHVQGIQTDLLVALVGVVAVTCFQIVVLPHREFTQWTGPTLVVAVRLGILFGYAAFVTGWMASLYVENETPVTFGTNAELEQ